MTLGLVPSSHPGWGALVVPGANGLCRMPRQTGGGCRSHLGVLKGSLQLRVRAVFSCSNVVCNWDTPRCQCWSEQGFGGKKTAAGLWESLPMSSRANISPLVCSSHPCSSFWVLNPLLTCKYQAKTLPILKNTEDISLTSCPQNSAGNLVSANSSEVPRVCFHWNNLALCYLFITAPPQISIQLPFQNIISISFTATVNIY